jgi:hypothetical protein
MSRVRAGRKRIAVVLVNPSASLVFESRGAGERHS